MLIVLHYLYLGIIHRDREVDIEDCHTDYQGGKHDITLSILEGCHAMPRCPGPRCACHSSLFLLDNNPSDFLAFAFAFAPAHDIHPAPAIRTHTLITSPTYRRSSTQQSTAKMDNFKKFGTAFT